MKFPRSARIFRGHLDVAPFASVFFLLVIFVLLGSLIYTPGVRVELDLPRADELTGTDRPTIAVAMDREGRYYYDNQPIEEQALNASLRQAAQKSPEPLTLLVRPDKNVTYDSQVRLIRLAKNAGITNFLFAVLPQVFPGPLPEPNRP